MIKRVDHEPTVTLTSREPFSNTVDDTLRLKAPAASGTAGFQVGANTRKCLAAITLAFKHGLSKVIAIEKADHHDPAVPFSRTYMCDWPSGFAASA